MAREDEDLWQTMLRGGQSLASEEDYEHGYAREVRGDLQRYVAFRVGNEIYGLPIVQIEEISKLFATTPVPRTARHLLGIGNVRGNIMPIIDVCVRLNIAGAPRSRTTRVLIVWHKDERYGLVVDEVLDVISMAPEQFEEVPDGIAGAQSHFIRALARYGHEILIILELTTVLDSGDLVAFRNQIRQGA